ncbi:MAG TPA: tetratricopeptide repeat protein [Thermoanaerobaculia bacterium]|nr:tetratricopeptide repeat protein [Thermoanaerobaculia bacterium]
MMIERHYDDESLIALLESDRLGSDSHIPGCPHCTEKLESFRMIADALREADVWNETHLHDSPVQSTIHTLRAFADRMTDEDAQATAWLDDLLAGPRETWKTKLAQHPEYRTAGMVRKLIAASDRAIDTMPPDALEITGLAADIADHLDPAAYPSETVVRLRGAAWREKAFSLFYTGQHAAAEKAVQIADAMFSLCTVDEYDRARVAIVKSLVHRSMEQFDGAIETARQSAEVFRTYGDVARVTSAKSSEAGVLAHSRRYEGALAIWLDLEKQFDADDATDTHARLLSNIAYACSYLGRTEEALTHYQFATELFDLLGNRSEAARLRWNVASILLQNGRLKDAEERLVSVRRELEELSMLGPAGVAALDLAEIRLLQGRIDDVIELCGTATRHLNNAGIAYTETALRAIAYVREAAELGRATPQLVKQVREYVRRLPAEPELLFLPLPDARD